MIATAKEGTGFDAIPPSWHANQVQFSHGLAGQLCSILARQTVIETRHDKSDARLPKCSTHNTQPPETQGKSRYCVL